MDVQKAIHQLLKVFDCAQLASHFGVSTSTVSRWKNGHSRPRPNLEGEIRTMAKKVVRNDRQTTLSWQPVEHQDFGNALADTLRQVREVFHRSARLASRNEALTELSKLLFAHFMATLHGHEGIASRSLLTGEDHAKALKSFVAKQYHEYLPRSLSHEFEERDFELQIRETENRFAKELIQSFAPFAKKEVRRFIQKSDGLDVLNNVFGQFIADSFVEEKELGQYLTPIEVVHLMVRLGLNSLSKDTYESFCDPDRCAKAGLILDPSCGVGSFLTEVLRVLYSEVKQKATEAELSKWVAQLMSNTIVGIDKSERMVKLALTNLAMFGAPAANLHLANALLRSKEDGEIMASMRGRVQLILTNPPFGAEFASRDLDGYRLVNEWSQRKRKTIDSELLFMERYVEWLAPGGILVAIVPDSILTNKGIYEDLRNGLASSAELINVISLPAITFGAAGTTTKTSILHLRKVSKDTQVFSKVYFANCTNIGYEISTRGANRRKVVNNGNELPQILPEALRKSEPRIGRVVDFVTSASRWDAAYHAGLPRDIQRRLDQSRKNLVTVADVAELIHERFDPRRLGDECFQYIEISDIDANSRTVGSKKLEGNEAPSRARKRVKAGDVLVSTVRPERKAVGVVPPDLDNAVCSTGFAVLRCKSISSPVLALLLQSNFANLQILRNNVGIAYPAIEEGCLLDIVLPIRPEQLLDSEKAAKALTETYLHYRETEKRLESTVNQLVWEWEQKTG